MGGVWNPNFGEFVGPMRIANIAASRSSGLIRFPALIGISDGATIAQAWPRPRTP
jgi:hypothetical protein